MRAANHGREGRAGSSRLLSRTARVKGKEKCAVCGKCIKTCFYDALSKQDRAIVVDRNKCDGCGLCTQLFPCKAITLTEGDRT